MHGNAWIVNIMHYCVTPLYIDRQQYDNMFISGEHRASVSCVVIITFYILVESSSTRETWLSVLMGLNIKENVRICPLSKALNWQHDNPVMRILVASLVLTSMSVCRLTANYCKLTIVIWTFCCLPSPLFTLNHTWHDDQPQVTQYVILSI